MPSYKSDHRATSARCLSCRYFQSQHQGNAARMLHVVECLCLGDIVLRCDGELAIEELDSCARSKTDHVQTTLASGNAATQAKQGCCGISLGLHRGAMETTCQIQSPTASSSQSRTRVALIGNRTSASLQNDAKRARIMTSEHDDDERTSA